MRKIASTVSTYAWTTILATVALSIAAYSTHLNFRFGSEFYGGQDVLTSNSFGSGFVVADVAKYILAASIAWAWNERRYVSAIAYIMLVAVAAIMSVAAMTSMGLQGQEATTSTARAQTSLLVDLKAERNQLTAEREAMGTVAPPAAIEARIAALRHDRRPAKAAPRPQPPPPGGSAATIRPSSASSPAPKARSSSAPALTGLLSVFRVQRRLQQLPISCGVSPLLEAC